MVEEGKTELRALGAAIRDQRKRLGVSQEDFAALCNLHRTYVGQIERGEKNISFVNMLRVSRAFRISLSDLFRKAAL